MESIMNHQIGTFNGDPVFLRIDILFECHSYSGTILAVRICKGSAAVGPSIIGSEHRYHLCVFDTFSEKEQIVILRMAVEDLICDNDIKLSPDALSHMNSLLSNSVIGIKLYAKGQKKPFALITKRPPSGGDRPEIEVFNTDSNVFAVNIPLIGLYNDRFSLMVFASKGYDFEDDHSSVGPIQAIVYDTSNKDQAFFMPGNCHAEFKDIMNDGIEEQILNVIESAFAMAGIEPEVVGSDKLKSMSVTATNGIRTYYELLQKEK